MERHHYGAQFAFSMVEESPQKQRAQITISHEFVDSLYQEAVHSQKMQHVTFGFQKGTTPASYIEQNFRANIISHIQELLFTHCVLHFLYSSLDERSMVIVGDPELIEMQVVPQADAIFVFMLNTVAVTGDQRWKKISIKMHSRKQYKDLDRQVQLFLMEEAEREKVADKESISYGDWVHFDMALHTKDHNPLLQDHANSLWVHISPHDEESPLHRLFIGKKPGDSFFSESSYLHDYVSPTQDREYSFFLTINAHIPSQYFLVDLFKHHFILKDDKDSAIKLIEVFSFRRDVSLHREIVDSVLRQLTKQYFFQIPTSIVDVQSDAVIQAVQDNPDYHVYKAQEDFEDYVRKLALKQLKETIIIDALSFQEKIAVSDRDVHAYLSLTFRQRTRQFIYFKPPVPKNPQGQESPIPLELIKQSCRREKTLNHIIHTLSRKPRS